MKLKDISNQQPICSSRSNSDSHVTRFGSSGACCVHALQTCKSDVACGIQKRKLILHLSFIACILTSDFIQLLSVLVQMARMLYCNYLQYKYSKSYVLQQTDDWMILDKSVHGRRIIEQTISESNVSLHGSNDKIIQDTHHKRFIRIENISRCCNEQVSLERERVHIDSLQFPEDLFIAYCC